MKSLKYFKLAKRERKLLLEAVVLLGLARLALSLLPFRRIAPYLGVQGASASSVIEDRALVRQIRWAVQTAACHVPWKAVCLPQAIAAKLILRRRGITSTLFLGVLKENNLQAHAWLRVGDTFVTGDKGAQQYTILVWFA